MADFNDCPAESVSVHPVNRKKDELISRAKDNLITPDDYELEYAAQDYRRKQIN